MPQDDFFTQLRILYRAAGQPSARRISGEISDRELPDTVSHGTVNTMLGGSAFPRWSKVECVVRVLAEMAAHRPDPQAEVHRFLVLWNQRTDTMTGAGALSPSGAAEDAPATEPPNGTVPPRKPGFTGREDLLAAMREGSASWQPLILYGLSGVGKTSLAAEFVHREMARYDVIWWIVAEHVAGARSSLAALADQLPQRVEVSRSDMQQTLLNVLGALEHGTFSWLLVYDNATGPERIQDLLPTSGRGTVIVTTPDSSWSEQGRGIPVGVLSRQDSIALLQRASTISFDDADRLADKLGDLPLALEQSTAMRAATNMSVSEYLRRLDAQASVVLGQGSPGDYPGSLAGAFGFAYDEVRQESAGAAQLLAMLSCLRAGPVSTALLRTAAVHSIPPPLGRVLAQDAQLDAALQVLERYGLITLTDNGQRAQVHRLVQLVVRDLLAEAERDQAYDNARRLLAASNPGDPDERLTWEMHGQIGPHIAPTTLTASTDAPMRRLVLDQIRYLYVRGDFDGSLRLSGQARQAWAGPEDVWEDDETFACIDRYASALIGLGRYREADRLYNESWNRLNSHGRFGSNHDRTARTASGLAAVSRILGRYVMALNLEGYRVEHYQRGLDSGRLERKNELLRAKSNLAVCYRATGDFERAREIDEEVVDEWRQAETDSDYRTLFAMSNLARDLYGLGRYEEALRLQEDFLPAMRDMLNRRHPWVMAATRTTVIALRKTGRITEALRAGQQHHRACQGEWGSEHADALAAAMTYANTVRAGVAAGVVAAPMLSVALNISLRAVNTYRIRFGETNPVSLAAAVNHAAILRQSGDRSTARLTCESAFNLLVRQVGHGHPYTQAAGVGLAGDMAAVGETASADRLLRSILDSNRAAHQEQHPDVRICAINLGLVTRERDPQGAAALIEPNLSALREALGSEHPVVVAAARGERGECDIEPPPF